MNYLKYILIIIFLAGTRFGFAQNKLEISKRSPIYLEFASANNAGLKGGIIADDSQWLNYTVLIGASDPTVSISVSIASGEVPKGMELYVEALQYRGFSRGKIGVPTGKVAVSHIPQRLIDNIGTSYTGSGRNEGHQLIFSFKIKDYAKLEPGVYSVYIQYTITQ